MNVRRAQKARAVLANVAVFILVTGIMYVVLVTLAR